MDSSLLGFKVNVYYSSQAHWKVRMDILLVLIELFVTCEALRAKMDQKSAFCKRVGLYPTKFHVEGPVKGTSCTNNFGTER